MPSPDRPPFDRAVIGLLLAGVVVLSGGVAIGVATGGVVIDLAEGGKNPGAQTVASGQVNPEEVQSGEQLGAVERQLAGRLASRVRSGAIQLSESDYERARESLSDSEYSSLLERYSDVAERTGRENRSQLFLQLRRSQQRYAELGDRYRRLQLAYEDSTSSSEHEFSRVEEAVWEQRADELGLYSNVSRSRQLARRMEHTYDQINRTGLRMLVLYRKLSDQGGNYADARRGIRQSLRNFSETQSRIRRAEFTIVEMRTAVQDRNASFVDPLRVRGQVVTSNGTGIGRESIRLVIANQSTVVETNASGHFDVAYRPTTLPVNATEVTVEFDPGFASSYTDAQSSVPIRVNQVRPAIQVRTEPESLGYNDSLVVSGWIGADETGAGRVPYVVTIGDRFLGRGSSDADGHFSSNGSLAATIRPGQRQVEVSLLAQNRAIGPANASTVVTVRERRTSLTLVTTQEGNRVIEVQGRLSVVNGQSVGSQNIQILANETAIGTATTGSDGRFETSVIVPPRLARSGLMGGVRPVSVTAVYRGEETNLRSSRSSGTVPVESPPEIDPTVVAVMAAILVTGIGSFYWRRRTTLRHDNDEHSPESHQGWEHPKRESLNQSDPSSLVERARSHLVDGRCELAVQSSYVALRRLLEDGQRDTSRMTHWEFYRHCQTTDVDEETIETLERVTGFYEQVLFATETVSPTVAQQSIDRVAALLDRDSGAR